MTGFTLVRQIKARPAIVFEALTTADGIAAWWGPDALPVVSAQSLLARVGLKPGEPKFQDVAIPSVAPVGSAAVAVENGTAPQTVPQAAPAAPKSTVLPGTVLSQSPPAGYRVDVGAVVTFTVAK